jgi:hypothetical protein
MVVDGHRADSPCTTLPHRDNVHSGRVRVRDAPLSEQRLQVLLLLHAQLRLDGRGLLLRHAGIQLLQAQVGRGGCCHLLDEPPNRLPGRVTGVLAHQVLTHEALAEVERPHAEIGRASISR